MNNIAVFYRKFYLKLITAGNISTAGGVDKVAVNVSLIFRNVIKNSFDGTPVLQGSIVIGVEVIDTGYPIQTIQCY